MIKISFIVPIYNLENYIDKCLNSLINQSMREIEIITVDDGSKDGTLEKLKTFAKLDNRIKICKQENLGANMARKVGLRNATGEYVIFVDGDDWVEENLACDLYKIAKEKEYDILYYNYCLVFENKKKYRTESIKSEITSDEYLKLLLEEKISHNLFNRLFKRIFLIESNFYDIPNITMGDDLAANIRLACNNPTIKICNDTYYNYYQREDSVTKKSSKKVLEIEKAIKDIEVILKKNKKLLEYEEQLEYLWFKHLYFYRIIVAPYIIEKNEKILYQLWKEKNIFLKKNSLYLNDMNKFSN